MDQTPVFDTYWKFAVERQAMFFRRLSDPVGPWTDDPILASYRFTNAYRASDRVSQYLIRHVQYHPDRSSEPPEIFFRTLLFKLFNRVDTWEALERHLGPIEWRTIDLNAVARILDGLMERGNRLYSAAYIMPAPPFGHPRKHTNHLALLARMMEDQMPKQIHQAKTLRAVYEQLFRYPGIGRFLAFQYSIDLNYSTLLTHSEDDFVVAGPGALDGIAKCFSNAGGRDAEAVIYWMCDQQERTLAAAGLAFATLYGRRLKPIDCQNLFCEISKYARIAHPEQPGLSGRTRIKQGYRRHSRPLPGPMYPPRWGLEVGSSEMARSSIKAAFS
jgi:hypothetical protein